uniref:Ubiquitin-like domain-containing protein n=1 Tax=Ditylenchus dipsaci TaxID=166011 RepID=A0A915CRZ2_9BILA
MFSAQLSLLIVMCFLINGICTVDIHVEIPHLGQKYNVYRVNHLTVAALRKKIGDTHGIAWENYSIYHGNELLSDEQLLEDIRRDGTLLNLTLKKIVSNQLNYQDSRINFVSCYYLRLLVQ